MKNNLRLRRFLSIIILILLFGLTGCTKVQRAWRSAEKQQSVLGYEKFLEAHGNSTLADSAVTRIKQIYLDDARTMNAVVGYEAFLKKYPRGRLSDSARVAIEKLYYREALITNQIPTYRKFITRYPNSLRTIETQKEIDALIEARHPECRDIHTVKILVEDSYRRPQGPIYDFNLPFRDVASRILTTQGLDIVTPNEEADATMWIQCDGILTNDLITADKEESIGAILKLEGNISFRKGRNTLSEKIFSVAIHQPQSVLSHSRDVDLLFQEAFWTDGSYPAEMFRLTGDLFGYGSLVYFIGSSDLISVQAQSVLIEAGFGGVPDLLRVFQSEDPAQIQAAAMIAGAIGDTIVSEALIDLLDHPAEKVRTQAIQSIGLLKIQSTAAHLVSLLKDPSLEVRRAAAATLGEFQDASVLPYLLSAINEDDKPVRLAAILSIGNIADSSALPELVRLLSDEDSDITAFASESLFHMGRKAVPILIQTLDQGSSRARSRAARILGRLKAPEAIEPLTNTLGGNNAALASIAKDALSQYGLPALDPVMKAMKRLSARKDVLVVLGTIPAATAFDTLIHYLRNGTSELRWNAARGLGKTRNSKAVPFLIQALENDQDVVVRIETIIAMGEIGDTRSLSSLERILSTDDTAPRLHAIEAIGKIQSPRTISILLPILDDSNPEIVLKAIPPLVDHADTRVLKKLVDLCAHPDRRVRKLVQQGIQLHRDRVAPLLVQALGQDDRNVKKETTDLIGRMRVIEAIPRLLSMLDEEDVFILSAVREAILYIGEPAIRPLIRILNHRNMRIRNQAMDLLGNLKARFAIDPILRILEDDAAAVKAAEALGRIGDSSTAPNLRGKLKTYNPALLQKTVEALGLLEDSEAVPLIVPMLHSNNQELRRLAIQALTRIDDLHSINPMLDLLKDPDQRVRSETVQGLVKFGADAVDPLIEIIKTGKPSFRKQAADILGQIGTPAIPALIELLKRGDTKSQWHALDVIYTISLQDPKDTRLVEPLIALLPGDNEYIAEKIQQALRGIGKTAVPALALKLHDPDWKMRWSVVEIMGYIKDPRSLRLILPMLDDPNHQVREATAKALRKTTQKDFGMNRKKWARWIEKHVPVS
ncbi:HEAT repeat domain-containing protein [candidate division KSB1 bacterium]|nr:HEAT repeat domain-containing protein [candidate division KSB1 bacterium]